MPSGDDTISCQTSDRTVNSFQRWNNLVHREFYGGDLSAWEDGTLVRIATGFSSPIKIIRISSNSSASFKRGRKHIQKDKSGVIVISFILRGECKIIRGNKTITIVNGHFIVKDPNTPFISKMSPINGEFDAIYVVVPRQVYIDNLSTYVDLDQAVRFDLSGAENLFRLLELFCDWKEPLGARTAEAMAGAFLAALADHLESVGDVPSSKRSPGSTKLTEIKREIARNLADPDLTPEKLAARCNISIRYLYHLLKQESTTYARFLWSRRLEQARAWLRSYDMRHYSIQEIASFAGFKNPAHFSRVFKATFGTSPSSYRDGGVAGI